MARLDGTDIACPAGRECGHSLRRLPAFTAALGKALLAERTGEEVRPRRPAGPTASWR